MLPTQWRTMTSKDVCCSQNKLVQGEENGVVINGAWICPVCSRVWCGNRKDDLDHSLRTMTEFGEVFLKAMDSVIRTTVSDNPLAFRLTNVLLKIKEQNPQVSWNDDGTRKNMK